MDSSKALQVAKDYVGRDAEVVPVAIWPDGLYGFIPETHRLYWVLRANASLRVGAAEYVAVSRESGAPQTVFITPDKRHLRGGNFGGNYSDATAAIRANRTLQRTIR